MRRQNNDNKYILYLIAFQNTVRQYAESPDLDNRKDYIKRAVFYGVKAVNAQGRPRATTRGEAESIFQFASTINLMIGLLTPSEFMSIFPIAKDFKGHKWGSKDYFYTRDYLETLSLNEPIGGEEEALNFMWEYTNWDITEFNVNVMSHMSQLRQLDGYPSLAEEWADMNGIQTHTVHEDEKGNAYIIKDGKTIKLGKPRPRHLKIVK